jgi:hypothetical protein
MYQTPQRRRSGKGKVMFNISTAKIGGIRFLKIGRFCFSFCVTHEYRALAR